MSPAANRNIPLCSAFLLIMSGALALAQAPGRTIARIEIEGLQRLSAAEVILTSGLKIGAPVSAASLDVAWQKLVDSGLFSKVGYRTTSKGNQVTVIFQLMETKGGSGSVVFDNFVWFTNDELAAAILRDVPAFNGTAPNGGNTTDRIRQALQNLLKERQMEGTVEYTPSETGEHIFSVAGIHTPICRVHYPGATNVSEERLEIHSQQLRADEYSLQGTIGFSHYTLYPFYREAGQWHAKFGTPTVKVLDEPNCKRGVELTIPVDEGPIYLWDKAEWSGNQVLTAIQLDATLGMKEGQLANGTKFDKGLHELSKRYGLTGYLDVSFDPKPEFDETTHRLTAKIAVKEGPQYRMGKLTIKGIPELDGRPLEQHWKLKRGDVFDMSYPDQFLKTDGREDLQRIVAAWQAQGKPLPAFSFDIKPDRQAVTVDVTMEIKNPD
jgi:outer membrane protein insertion porin family